MYVRVGRITWFLWFSAASVLIAESFGCATSSAADDTCVTTGACDEPDAAVVPDAGQQPSDAAPAAQTICGDDVCDEARGESCTLCPVDCGACCGNDACEASLSEDCTTCSADCGSCAPSCGNDACEPGLGEDCSTCPGDCGSCCGNNTCESAVGESCSTCPSDCGGCCGNGMCEQALGESCSTCSADCGSCCGDNVCAPDAGETCSTCSADCGSCAATCGDSFCDTGIGETCSTCSADCGSCCGNGMCEAMLGETCDSCAADCSPLQAPTNLTPNSGSIMGLSVNTDWDLVCGAVEYEVDVYFLNSSSVWTPYYIWETPNDFFTFWPVVTGNLYFRVRGGDGSSWGDWSANSYFNFAGQ